jgi:NADPH:quinone reductase-like Zn-dependent oxidoreductase
MLRRLGADEVIDYTQEDVARQGVRYDFILDVPGNRPFSEFRRALEPDGRYVPIGHEGYGAANPVFGLIPSFLGLMLRSRFVHQLRASGFPTPTRQEALATLRDLLESGAVTPLVDSVFPFRDVHQAFRHMIEDETLGKVILVPELD